MAEPQTPDWVRDAIFYQIFPDRFPSSLSVPKPAYLDALGEPAHALTGTRAATSSASSNTSTIWARPRRQRDLLHADLPVGLEPSLSHARLLPGRPDARRRPALRD